MRKSAGALVLTTTLLIPGLHAASGWSGPEPFRLERLEGRQFDYNLESFLQRLSFTEKPIHDITPLWQQNGWYGTGGSSRGKEFYVHSLLQQKLQFDQPIFAGFRHKRSEDLDGRYDRTLFGVGYQPDKTWDIGVWADVSGAKEDMDLQLEANRYFANGSWLTGAVVLADVFYNSKTYSDNSYQRKPVTLYVAGGQQWQQHTLSGFINANLQTRYQDAAAWQLFSDEQYSAGLSWQSTLSANTELAVQGQGLYGRRSLQQQAAASDSDWLLRRHFQQLNVELRQQAAWPQPFTLGVQASRLQERDSRYVDGQRAAEYRRELFSYITTEHVLAENWLLRPTLYAGYGSVRSEFRQHSDEPLTDNGWLAKISPNFIWQLSAQTGAYVLLNPTVKLHNLQFGGGNIQVFMPF